MQQGMRGASHPSPVCASLHIRSKWSRLDTCFQVNQRIGSSTAQAAEVPAVAPGQMDQRQLLSMLTSSLGAVAQNRPTPAAAPSHAAAPPGQGAVGAGGITAANLNAILAGLGRGGTQVCPSLRFWSLHCTAMADVMDDSNGRRRGHRCRMSWRPAPSSRHWPITLRSPLPLPRPTLPPFPLSLLLSFSVFFSAPPLSCCTTHRSAPVWWGWEAGGVTLGGRWGPLSPTLLCSTVAFSSVR